MVASFPPHWVEKLSDGEWLIYNDNVTMVSTVGEESAYDERGFLSVPDAEEEVEGVLRGAPG